MIPYLLLLFFVVFTAYFGRRSGSKVAHRISIGAVMVALVGFAGLRDYRVGTDTGTYVRQFSFSESFASVTDRGSEVGYGLLAWLARNISDSYTVLLLMIAAIVVSCYVPTIVKLTRRYETALFLFITLGVYTFFFNGARQGIAAAICFAALPFLLERRLIPYLLTVGVAALFHQTALIALVLYPLASPRVDWRRLALVGAATVVLVVFLQVFVGLAATLLDDKFAAYAVEGEGGGQVWVAFLLGQGVMLYLFKDKVRDQNGYYGRLLNIYLIGLIPAVASTLSGVNPSGLLRLHLYFSSVAVLLWPMVFLQFKTTPLRGLLALGFAGVTLLFFLLTTSTFSNLTPYRLNLEMVSW
ncbi:EpsG family protein [Luteimonas arsenica]|uniref:EpsG family protein n=1 Tax=Luteimonas arsenica TaxID=1586242 RepID=UPI0010568C7C|nr:EpsG family protein [Luteimonas arsenica]